MGRPCVCAICLGLLLQSPRTESLGLSALQQGRFSQEHTHFLLAEVEDVGVCDGEPLDDDDAGNPGSNKISQRAGG
jgi:hypothetical protein